jgi:uncharacterized membrane protein
LESKVKLLGHPLHPIMVVFPLGLLITSVIFDIVHWITGNGFWSESSFWIIAAGLVGGIIAASIGTIDWIEIPSGTRAKVVGLRHGAGNYIILILFAVSWFIRSGAPGNPFLVAYLLSFLGAALLGVTGWLGGELTLRLGVGVDEGAHLNAPSSLSGKPARPHATNTGKAKGQSATK